MIEHWVLAHLDLLEGLALLGLAFALLLAGLVRAERRKLDLWLPMLAPAPEPPDDEEAAS